MIKFNRQFAAREMRLLIFDLDGTLIDSRQDLIESVNAMLRQFGRAELPGELIASYVGDGAPMLVRRALGDPKDAHFLQQALDAFLAHYRVHKLDHTHLYPGIREALAAMKNANGTTRQLAVLSNKPVNPSRQILESLEVGTQFMHIYGGNSFSTKKPDPLGARTLLEQAGVDAQQAIMIGDSSIDIITGRNAGMWTCGVTYGFAPHTLCEAPPDVVVDSPAELGNLFCAG